MSSYADGRGSSLADAGDSAGLSECRGVAPPSAALADMIEAHIIPRLMLAHRPEGAPAPRTRVRVGAAGNPGFDIPAYARAAIRLGVEDLLELAGGYAALGATVEGVFLDLLAPAARELGVMWERDTATFAEVSIGLTRLHAVVHALAAAHPVHHPANYADRRIVLAAPPGEQHTLGLVMLGELFRRDGWAVSVETPRTTAELAQIVREDAIDVLGLSIGGPEIAERVPEVVAAVRRAARTRDLKVIAGGPWCLAGGGSAERLGVDAIVRQADGAVAAVRALLAEADVRR